MKIAFVSPHGVEVYQPGHIFNEFISSRRQLRDFTDDELEVMPNLALLTLAAIASANHEAHYFEEGYYVEKGVQAPYLDMDFDLVALSAFTYQAPQAYRIADHFRTKGVAVVMGGNHVTAMPEEALQHADHVIVGEGEDVFPQFLNDLENGDAMPVYESKRCIDLGDIPPPRFDLVPDAGRYNKIPIQATRGCPYHCEFCSITAVYGHNYRRKPVENVIDEIRLAQNVFPRCHISFVDENMLVDKEYSKTLLRSMLPLDVPWECYCDVSIADDPELLDLMRESGCYEIQVGLETVNPESLKEVSPWKYKKLKRYPEYIKTIQDHGVGVMGLFMLGMDRDGPDIFKQLWEFIRDNNIFEADLAIMQPLPGSDLYKRLKEEGRITSEDWNRYTWYHVNHMPAGMTTEQLKQGMQWLHRKIHSEEWMERKRSKLNPRPAEKNPCAPSRD